MISVMYHGHPYLESKNVNDSFGYFHQQLMSTIDKHAPLQKVKRKPKSINLPWLTNAIKRSISTCKKLYAISIHANSTEQEVEKYKNYHKILNRSKRIAKCMYFNNMCCELKYNGAKLWSLITSTINKTQNKKEIIERLQIGSIEVTRSEEIANVMGNYYSTIGLNLYNKVPPSTKNIDYYVNKINQSDKSLYFSPTSIAEVEKFIMKLKNKPSSGHDQISNVMLKWLCPVVSGPLAIIFNKSLTEGVFPDIMKLSDVIPLYKSKEKISLQ